MGKLIITSKKLGSFEVLYDDIDHELISKKHWFPYRNNPSNKNVYAKSAFNINGKRKWMFMHRLILLDTPRSLHIDHKNGDGLDNRRENIRICTPSQNCANSSKSKNNLSGYKGIDVIIRKTRPSYRARIMVNRKKIHLGCFDSCYDACCAYNNAAIKYFGEFARLNPI